MRSGMLKAGENTNEIGTGSLVKEKPHAPKFTIQIIYNQLIT